MTEAFCSILGCITPSCSFRGCVRIHFATRRIVSLCGCVRIHFATRRIVPLRGCGEIGIRIRFRILRREACRFDPCHPHQTRRAALVAALLVWCGRLVRRSRTELSSLRENGLVGEFFCTVLALNVEGKRNWLRKVQAYSLRETLLSTRSVRIAEFDPCHPHHRKKPPNGGFFLWHRCGAEPSREKEAKIL